MAKYWKRVVGRAWKRSLELARLESGERRATFAISLIAPFLILWFALDDSVSAGARTAAALGGTLAAIAVMFVWLILKMPAVIEAEQLAEKAALQIELDGKNTQQSALNEIADHVALAPVLLAKKLTSEHEYQQWRKELNVWTAKAQLLVHIHFGEARSKSFLHVTRLEDPSIFNTVFNDEHQGLKRLLRELATRLQRLVEGRSMV